MGTIRAYLRHWRLGTGPGIACVTFFLAAGAAIAADGKILQVGPGREIRSLAAAAAQARNGDTVEVDAGTYAGDVAVWTQDGITIRGVGGPVRLDAAGASAEGKAIWVLRGGKFRVENIEFRGTRVRDRNGAGIRLEKGRLTVRNCLFDNNENGILTGGDAGSELIIENSEFVRNGAGDGQSHNLYVGPIRRLSVTGSYFHHARVGHLLKSRAQENYIAYNRLTDEAGGSASYELEFTSGGVAHVMGNIIQQAPTTQNPYLISYGAEGYQGQRHELYLVNNTLVDERQGGGMFVRVSPGKVKVVAANNLLVGPGPLALPADAVAEANHSAAPGDFASGPPAYRLSKTAAERLAGKVVAVDDGHGASLVPTMEYVHPLATRALPKGLRRIPGALQTAAP